MHRIGLVGVSWKHVPPERQASLAIPPEQRAERLPALARAIGASELVYLATCNRVEVCFASDGSTPLAEYRLRLYRELFGSAPEPGTAERALRAWAGEGAAEHVFLVAAGLESARVGETEIAAQVRAAAELARALGLLGPRLSAVYDEALRAAKKVHASTGVGQGKVSLAEVALERVRERLKQTPGALCLVGVSPMTERIARELGSSVDLVIANRTLAKAEQLARTVGGCALSLDELRAAPPALEALVCAVGSPEPVLERAALERIAARTPSRRPPLIVDFGAPPNVESQVAAAAGVERIGMDEITAAASRNRGERLNQAADAREIVDQALVGLRRRLSERLLGPMQAALHRRYQESAAQAIERLLTKELSGLGEGERETVRRWAEGFARRCAYLPASGLRELVEAHGFEAAESFFAAADPELRSALESALADADRPRPQGNLESAP